METWATGIPFGRGTGALGNRRTGKHNLAPEQEKEVHNTQPALGFLLSAPLNDSYVFRTPPLQQHPSTATSPPTSPRYSITAPARRCRSVLRPLGTNYADGGIGTTLQTLMCDTDRQRTRHECDAGIRTSSHRHHHLSVQQLAQQLSEKSHRHDPPLHQAAQLPDPHAVITS